MVSDSQQAPPWIAVFALTSPSVYSVWYSVHLNAALMFHSRLSTLAINRLMPHIRNTLGRSLVSLLRNLFPTRKRRTQRASRGLALTAIAECEVRLLLAAAFAEFVDPHPAAGNQFGTLAVPLSTGNVVITSPYDDAGGTDAGAVYLFNGATGALISTLTGSHANDNIGSDGVAALTNGNFVVSSKYWSDGGVSYAGAVTWGSGTVGVSGVVSATNSIVGSQLNDRVGSGGVTPLANGNYVVRSGDWDNEFASNAGAVTWGNGATGISGLISASNSLIGSTANDAVGYDRVTALSNGNYVVTSFAWTNGVAANAGAVTWGSGTTGVSGVISAANSLVGGTQGNQIGYGGITELSNGNYVINSYNWDNGGVQDVGAVTWCSGTTAMTGVVSATNSLVGTRIVDRVGSGGITALANGNYVVTSSEWDNGTETDAGAVTWGSGTTGVTGPVSPTNSLVGSTVNDFVGNGRITPLSNGNYVVSSYQWDNGTVADAGAVTWGNGTTGVTGFISASNSLVGGTWSDLVGGGGIMALTNGNYVVNSPVWDRGGIFNAGAVTWGSGTSGVTGVVSESNSLVGSSESDRVGYGGMTALTNGNYVVLSSGWSNGVIRGVGAVTLGNGSAGTAGTVTATNSLVGSSVNDLVGSSGITALNNGNYLVSSNYWNNGATTDAGAVTWGNGTTGVTGVVSATNSLVGNHANDQVGNFFFAIATLNNGNYVVRSPLWDAGATADAGAVTWGNGTTGVVGVISSSNSLVGTSTNDQIGNGGVTSLTNGNYVIRSPLWDHINLGQVESGAVTWGNGIVGSTGLVSAANSIVGETGSTNLQSLTLDPTNVTYFGRFLNENTGSGRVRVGSQTSGIANAAPTALSIGNAAVARAENSSSAVRVKVGDVLVTDDYLGTNVLSLSGTDAASFEIVGTELFLKAGVVLNYEAKTSYSVTVNVDDPTVGATPDAAVGFTLNVTNVNEAPVVANTVVEITENSPNGTGVGVVSATDPDVGQVLSYSITGGNTGGAWAINPVTGQITVANSAALDFETTPVFHLTVQVTDNGVPPLSTSATVTINLLNQFEVTPSALQSIVPLYQYPLSAPNTLSPFWQQVLNNATADHPVTAVINPSSGPLDPSPGGADYANYITAMTLLRANPNVRILGYVATGFGLTSAATILQRVGWYASGYKHPTTGASLVDGIFLDEMSNNVAHVASYTTVATGIRATTGLAGHLIAGNPGTAVPVQYLDAGTADVFIIREGTLADLLANPVPAYVKDPAYNTLAFAAIIHTATGAKDLPDALRQFKLSGLDYGYVTDDTLPNPFDQAPTFFPAYLTGIHAPYLATGTASLPENTANGTAVFSVTAGDPDPGQTLSYSLVGGNTNGAFAINPATGQITVVNSSALNFETTPTFNLSMQVTDNGSTPLSDINRVTIQLTNVNEAPVFTSPTSFTFEEFSARWTVIGRVGAADPEGGTVTYSIVSGNPDNTLFLSDGSAPADAGKLWVNVQDLTGLRHRGMFNVVVRVTDNSAGALFTDTLVKVFIAPAPAGNVTVAPSVDGFVSDLDGNGFSGADALDTTSPSLAIEGGAHPSRGLLDFNLASIPAGKVLKSAWLFFSANDYGGTNPTGSVPVDVYGYAGDGVLSAADATLGTKIGSRPITGVNTSNQKKVHSAQLDTNFVRSFVGTGTLGLVLRNDGTTDRVSLNTLESSVGAVEKPYLVLQFVSDAKSDVAVRDVGATGTGNGILTLTSNGSSFTVNTENVFGVGSWERFVTGDFNGDGKADIAARLSTDGSWWGSMTNAAGVHQTATQWGAWSTGTTWSDVLVADFDHDGRADIAARDANGDWSVSRSTGAALEASRVWGHWSNTTTWSNVVTADFNRDGRADIAGRDSQGQWFVSTSTGTTAANAAFATSKWCQWSTTTTWSDVQVGDFNGDGRADIIGRSTIGQWWVNRSTGVSFGAALFYGNWSTKTTWSDVRVGDFNGDGRDDIIGRSSIGQVWVSEVATSGFSTRLAATWTGPQTKWSEVSVGDFNRDGHADLVARNNLTGEIWTSLWTPAIFTTSQWTTLPSPGTHQWRLLGTVVLT